MAVTKQQHFGRTFSTEIEDDRNFSERHCFSSFSVSQTVNRQLTVIFPSFYGVVDGQLKHSGIQRDTRRKGSVARMDRWETISLTLELATRRRQRVCGTLNPRRRRTARKNSEKVTSRSSERLMEDTLAKKISRIRIELASSSTTVRAHLTILLLGTAALRCFLVGDATWRQFVDGNAGRRYTGGR